MEKIIALTDYKNRFGSKHFDVPYRSGMDKTLLTQYFAELDYQLRFEQMHNNQLLQRMYNQEAIIYTSSEDIGYHYKSFIEDVVLGLSLAKATLIPDFRFLKANNNKVFMEMIREQELGDIGNGIKSCYFGSIEELKSDIGKIEFPCVLKTAEGASGTGVFLCNSSIELLKKAKKISRTRNFHQDLRDAIRAERHKGYIKESFYRRKFIVQNFIPNLKNDWKVIIFGKRIYVFFRPILKGRGIKASGGGYDNYLYGIQAKAPVGMFDFALKIFNKLKIPHISLDIAYDGNEFYLIEFQVIYFGTAGIPYSKGYFVKNNNDWTFIEDKLDLEKVYADSIVHFLRK
jgi:hypothetical protein